MHYFLTLYLDQHEYKFISTLHTSRTAAEAAFANLLREFVVPDDEPLPPREVWGSLFDETTGEAPHLYAISADGGPSREIFFANNDDVVTA